MSMLLMTPYVEKISCTWSLVTFRVKRFTRIFALFGVGLLLCRRRGLTDRPRDFDRCGDRDRPAGATTFFVLSATSPLPALLPFDEDRDDELDERDRLDRELRLLLPLLDDRLDELIDNKNHAN